MGLSQTDFYRERHGVVFAAMRALHQANEPIDHLTVSEQLQRQGQLEEVGGSGAIEELAGWVPAPGHGVQYARIVRELSQMRRLLTATYEIQAEIAERRQGGEELIDHAEKLIFALRADRLGARQRLLENAVEEEIGRLELAAAAEERALPGLPTGLPELDRLLGGLQNGRCMWWLPVRRWVRVC